MKDYSKLIQSSYGYIIRYEIVGNELHVYTAESEKGEPHKFPANKEWIDAIEKRLEKQYKTLVDNKASFREEYVKKGNKKLNLVALIISSILLSASGLLFLLELGLVSIPVIASSVLVVVGNKMIVSKREKDFDQEMVIIKSYLDKRNDIAAISCVDSNVVSYLSSDTEKRIEENRELEKRQMIDTVFNIDFMDKTSLKDLKKMLNRYYITSALNQDQVFVDVTKKRKKIN